MKVKKVSFERLRQLLYDLGFVDIEVERPHVGFRRDDCDAVVILPPYRKNQAVAPHHLISVRVYLDRKGLLEESDFNQRLEMDSIEVSAPR